MASIIVTGQIARYPLGGVTWDWLNYLLGLKALGLDVYYYEENPEWLYNPLKNSVVKSSYNIDYLKSVMDSFGFSKRWCHCMLKREYNLSPITTKIYFGFSEKQMQKLFAKADAVINIGGACNLGRIENIKGKRIYIDVDPMLTQLRIATGEKDILANVQHHDYFFTYGENIGNPDCQIPLVKIQWQTTRFPVFRGVWRFRIDNSAKNFSTISNWQSYKGYVYRGKIYSGCKSIEFKRFARLPSLTKQPMELAVMADLHEKKNLLLNKTLKNQRWIRNVKNLNQMKSGGWSITDAKLVSKNWKTYQRYIYESRGEFSAAKNMYIKAKTGWFSGRSACYLAAGKPAVLQDTGFSKFIPTGRGLFAFSTVQEAANAVNEINKNYEYHCREARKIAEEYFDSKKILSKLLKDCQL